MTSLSSRPVARLSSPGDVVASVPSLCGFVPTDSVVLLSLRGPRRRVGLTIRLDLPGASSEAGAAQLLAERVAGDGAAAAVVVVYAARRRRALVTAVTQALGERGVTVTEALHVDGDRWTSYDCSRPCCPPEGTPVPPVPALVDVQCALDGRAVLASRQELQQSLAAPVLLEAASCLQALQEAERQWLIALEEVGEEAVRAQVLELARSALAEVEQGQVLDLPRAAQLALGLHDVRVRDEVATWSLTDADAVLSLAEQLVRRTTPPYDAPACTLLAWVAYARGDGSRANVALDRALATDPAYSLAQLLRTALDGALPPRDVREVLRGTQRALRG